jgi:uncharacterized protein
MDWYIIIVIIITSIIQSFFGVGVLLFGTPLLLLLGYPFFESLLIVLPVSASINLGQILKDYRHIDFKFYKNILLFSIPFIILCLFLVDKVLLNVSIYIGLFLIFIALKEHIKLFKDIMNKILSYNKIFYIIIGVVHGITNLGGALLTARVFHANLNKFQKRATIAISYMTFAIFQIITVLFLDYDFGNSNFIYIIIGLFVYITVNRFLFHRITDLKYDKLFSVFLIITGLLLIFNR